MERDAALRRVEQGPMREAVCAENNANFFNYNVEQSRRQPSRISEQASIFAIAIPRHDAAWRPGIHGDA
jgi:hypothetical protein